MISPCKDKDLPEMRRTLAQLFFHKTLDERNRFVHAEHRYVDGEIVRRRDTPFLVGIIIIVGSTRLVGLRHQLFRLFDRHAFAFNDALDTVLLLVMDKETEARRVVTQDIIGTASDNDTRALLRPVADGVALV